MAQLYSMIPETALDPILWRGLSDSAKAIYIELWCLATQCDARGAFTHPVRGPMVLDDIAYALRRDSDMATFKSHVNDLEAAGLLATEDGTLTTLYIPTFREANPTTQAERRRKWVDNKRGKRSPPPSDDGFDDGPDDPNTPPDDCPEEFSENPNGIQEDSDALSIKVKVNSKSKDKEIGDSIESTPPPDPSSKTKKAKKSTADPRSSHASIRLVHEITGKMPHKDTYDALIRVLGETPKADLLRECWQAWRSRGYRPDNFAWVLEWYANGGPVKAGPQNQAQPQRQFQARPGPYARPQAMYTNEQREAAKAKARQALAERAARATASA